MLILKLEIKGIKEILKTHDPKDVMLATHSALNKASKQGKTHAVKLIKERYNILPSRINQFLKLTARSSGRSFEAVITGKGQGLRLGYFSAKQVGVNASKKKGFSYNRKATKSGQLRRGGEVTAEIIRGSRKVINADPKPFIAVMKSGHVGVFHRTGQSRRPIEPLFGPGIATLFGSERINKGTTEFIEKKFEALFFKDLKWRFDKRNSPK